MKNKKSKSRTPKSLTTSAGPVPLRILSIGAHPADIFDQSGGTMAHHIENGDWVGCCVLTHGARIHDKVISSEMFRRRKIPAARQLRELMRSRSDVKAHEVRRACARLGVRELYFLGADDAVLLPNEAIVKRVARLLRQSKPDVILTHFPLENGGGWNPHAATGQIVLMAVGLAAAVDPGDRNPPHKITQVFFWGQGAAAVPSNVFHAGRACYNDTFIEISDVVEKKLACLDELISQGYGGAYARKRIETSDGAFGNACGQAYAEGFISWTAQAHHLLPVSKMNLRLARLSDHEVLGNIARRISTD